jgi:hypothetical protein
MATRPSETSGWTAAGINPPIGKKSTGWITNEKPPAQWHNWLSNIEYQWQHYVEENFAELLDAYQDDSTIGGMVVSGTGGLGISITSGLTLQNGIRVAHSGPTVDTVVDNSDTYLDFTDAGAFVKINQATGNPEPAVTANAVRIARIDALAGSIEVKDRRITSLQSPRTFMLAPADTSSRRSGAQIHLQGQITTNPIAAITRYAFGSSGSPTPTYRGGYIKYGLDTVVGSHFTLGVHSNNNIEEGDDQDSVRIHLSSGSVSIGKDTAPSNISDIGLIVGNDGESLIRIHNDSSTVENAILELSLDSGTNYQLKNDRSANQFQIATGNYPSTAIKAYHDHNFGVWKFNIEHSSLLDANFRIDNEGSADSGGGIKFSKTSAATELGRITTSFSGSSRRMVVYVGPGVTSTDKCWLFKYSGSRASALPVVELKAPSDNYETAASNSLTRIVACGRFDTSVPNVSARHFNVTSILRNSIGNYTITLDQPLMLAISSQVGVGQQRLMF